MESVQAWVEAEEMSLVTMIVIGALLMADTIHMAMTLAAVPIIMITTIMVMVMVMTLMILMITRRGTGVNAYNARLKRRQRGGGVG